MADQTMFFDFDNDPGLAPATDDTGTRLPDALDDYASLHAEDAAGLGL